MQQKKQISNYVYVNGSVISAYWYMGDKEKAKPAILPSNPISSEVIALMEKDGHLFDMYQFSNDTKLATNIAPKHMELFDDAVYFVAQGDMSLDYGCVDTKRIDGLERAFTNMYEAKQIVEDKVKDCEARLQKSKEDLNKLVEGITRNRYQLYKAGGDNPLGFNDKHTHFIINPRNGQPFLYYQNDNGEWFANLSANSAAMRDHGHSKTLSEMLLPLEI